MDAELRQLRANLFRMLAAGVPVFDAERLRADVETVGQWFAACGRYGERYASLGDAALERGARRTAGEYLALASLFHHFAQFLYFEDLEAKRRAQARKAELYRRAAPELAPPAERRPVPFDGLSLWGYLRRPPGSSDPSPCVILLPGLEATKEELRNLEDVFLARGLATFSFDGPGQGECRDLLPLDAGYHRAVSAVVDHLAGEPGIRADRLAVAGVSLGGLLAPYAAAHDGRLRCCAGIGGPFDLAARLEGAGPLTWRSYQYVTHTGDPAEARARLAGLSMSGVAARLTVPTLIVHGDADAAVPVAHAHLFGEHVRGAEVVVVEGGTHVCHNLPHIYRPLAADWVAARLAAPPEPGRGGGDL